MTELEFLAQALTDRAQAIPLPIDRVTHGMLNDRLWANAVAGADAAKPDLPEAHHELPEHRLAIAIGHHRVLICTLGTDKDLSAVYDRLRQALNQAAIDWSWLGSAGDDLLLVMVGPPGSDTDPDWHLAQEAVERNERVCRTLVWLPPSDPCAWGDAVASLVGRTFLARPWASVAHGGARLDAWAELAAELAAAIDGFPEAAARQWIAILTEPGDTDDIPERLVAALEART